jgi:ATP-dependent helicase/nuclease subunit A
MNRAGDLMNRAGDAAAVDLAALLAADRAARAEAQTRFDSPLVLEAGAGTGKTTTLVARLLAWCLGKGWEKAAALAAASPPAAGWISHGAAPDTPASAAKGPEAASDPGAAAAAREAVAARVLRGVVALTFTEAAAAEMAGRTARELLALARGGRAPDWLAAAGLPDGVELARRATALAAALDQLVVQTIHGFCLGLLTAHPIEAGVHLRLTVDADGRLLSEVIAEVVESALRQGYGLPGERHLLALAAAGCGPREIADALAILAAAGLGADELRRDPFAGDAWPRLRARLAAACGGLHDLLAPRLAGSTLKLANSLAASLAQLSASLVDPPPSSPAEHGRGESAALTRRPPPAATAAGLGVPAEIEEGPWDAEIAAVRRRIESLLPVNLRRRLAAWAGGSLAAKQEESRLGEIRLPLAAGAAELGRLVEHCAALDPARLRHGRLALAPLLAAVDGELRRRGIATFDALLRGAERLLASHAEVRAAQRRRIDQLLVDEFQDTDATQCEVLRWLALDGPAAERPGLFLVGDPKQSIYGWRSADLRAYEDFVARVRRAGGDVRPLVENFRSVPAILAEVGAVMAPLLCARPGVQPAWTPLVPCERRRADPGYREGGRAPVEHWVSWLPEEEQNPSPAAAAELEAAAIAADLREMHDRHGVPWRGAAILLRSTGDLDTYLEAMRRAGIPFAVGRDKQYFRRREVIDAAALVRTVLDPGDHLALVTWLRSPIVGVPDAALLPLWLQELPRLLTDLHAADPGRLAAVRRAVEAAAAALPPSVPAYPADPADPAAAAGAPAAAGVELVAGWDAVLLHAVEQLAVLRESAATEPADLFVERLRRSLLVDPTAAARYLGAYRLANLDRFFRQLLEEIEAGGGDVTAMLRALRASVAAGREAEEGRPPEGAEDAVQVLTIHGAKGLDFAHVYLPQLHKAAAPDRAPATEAGNLPAAGEGLAPGGEYREYREYRLLGAATPGFDRVAERRREVESAERVRTLYVAMTRAKDRLVLAGAWPRRERNPPPPEQARTHLHLLAWRPGCPDLAALWDAALAAPPDSPRATAEVLWKFPGLAQPPAELFLGLPLAGDLPGPSEVAAQAAWLGACRASAAARMARPFGGAASEEAHALLREELAARRAEDAAPQSSPGPGGRDDRRVAMAAGAALHRALELWDLAAEPTGEANRQRAFLPAYLSAVASGDEVERALPRCRALLDRFVAGGLAARLGRLAGDVLAREMPVLLAPPGDLAAAPGGPVGFISGAIDLLYRDRGSGDLVIADYKTDEVAGAALAVRAATYRSQGAAYVRAVQEALALASPPRFELWFVQTGEVISPTGVVS